MTDKKKTSTDLNSDILLADALLRLTALEKLLVQKGIITKEELNNLTTILVEKLTKVIMDKVQSSKDLNEFVVSLGNEARHGTKN